MKARRVTLVVGTFALLAGTLIATVRGVWLFAGAHGAAASMWDKVAEERTTLGAIRLAILAAAVYVVVSVSALIADGRWLNRVGPAGFEADGDGNSKQTIKELKEDLRRTAAERDRALGLYDVKEEAVS